VVNLIVAQYTIADRDAFSCVEDPEGIMEKTGVDTLFNAVQKDVQKENKERARAESQRLILTTFMNRLSLWGCIMKGCDKVIVNRHEILEKLRLTYADHTCCTNLLVFELADGFSGTIPSVVDLARWREIRPFLKARLMWAISDDKAIFDEGFASAERKVAVFDQKEAKKNIPERFFVGHREEDYEDQRKGESILEYWIRRSLFEREKPVVTHDIDGVLTEMHPRFVCYGLSWCN
jgi:hypothetical protein